MMKYQVYMKPYNRDEELQIVLENEEDALRAAAYIISYFRTNSDFSYVKKVLTEDIDEQEEVKFDTLINLKYGYFH